MWHVFQFASREIFTAHSTLPSLQKRISNGNVHIQPALSDYNLSLLVCIRKWKSPHINYLSLAISWICPLNILGRRMISGSRYFVSRITLAVLIRISIDHHAESDILYLNTAGTSIIILNTYEAAIELLERRSTLYSGRSVFSLEWCCPNQILTLSIESECP